MYLKNFHNQFQNSDSYLDFPNKAVHQNSFDLMINIFDDLFLYAILQNILKLKNWSLISNLIYLIKKISILNSIKSFHHFNLSLIHQIFCLKNDS